MKFFLKWETSIADEIGVPRKGVRGLLIMEDNMRVSLNRFALPASEGVRRAGSMLNTAMTRLSSGKKVQRPGDAPSDFGISQTLRFQIHRGNEAKSNLENARNMVRTADSWMQVVHDVLGRMSELATAANDGSKSQQDRETLNIEFQQLKEEIGRIARETEYNGVNIMGQDQILTYDNDKETFVFSQLDGNESYDLNTKVLSGMQGSNALDFQFSPGNDYTKSGDGRNIFYVDSQNSLVRYDIDSGELKRDVNDGMDKSLEVDEEGRLFYASETAPGSGVYALRHHDVATWQQDTTVIGSSDITDMDSKEFTVYDDTVYYLNTDGDIVSRSMNDFGSVRVELSSSDMNFTKNDGMFALSEDGQFMADVASAGTVRVTNMATKESNTFSVPSNITITDLTFGVDSQDIAFRDAVTGGVYTLEHQPGDVPELSNLSLLHEPSGATGFSGLALDGGSHRANFRVHGGPGYDEETLLLGADVRLNTLGLTRAEIGAVDDAQEALRAVQEAVDRVSVQRSRIGAEESRLFKAYDALTRYLDNIEASDSVLTDANAAEESANLAAAQVRYQASISMLAQANVQMQNVLDLLR